MNLIKWEKTFKEANEKEAKYFKVNKEYATRYSNFQLPTSSNTKHLRFCFSFQ